MKHKLFISTVALLIITIFGFSVSDFTPDDKPISLKGGNDYAKEWDKVDSLENKGLPKSAIKIIEAIYIDAKKSNNSNQIIKSFIYKTKFSSSMEEDGFENAIYDLKAEINTAKYPTKNIMQSVLGEMYWMYYQNNRYKFLNRSQTVNFSSDDIKTWDLNKLADETIKQYLHSLENADSLKRTAISLFETIIVKGENTENLHPTLFDFLGHRATMFFNNTEVSLSKPADYFQLKENYYFDNALKFANTEVSTIDTLSLHFYAIKVYQEITKLRLEQKNFPALINIELERLNFVYKNSVNPNKEELYKKALENLQKTFVNVPYSSNISYNLAKFYHNRGSKFNAKDSLSFKYKYDNKTSKELCESAINKYPKSVGAQKCKNLLVTITTKSLSFNVERVIASNNNFASLISYKNIEKVYFKIGKVDLKTYKRISKKNYGINLYDQSIKEIKIIEQGNINFPIDKDFNAHSIENVYNKKEIGHYVMFISNTKDFSYEGNLVSFKSFIISDLAYFSTKLNNGTTELYVVNRASGIPQPNVVVKTYYEKYNYVSRKYEITKKGTYTTNSNGKIIILKEGKNRNQFYKLEISNGHLQFKNSFSQGEV